MPWEGYNFEDAKFINKHQIYENIYTLIHIEKYETQPCTTWKICRDMTMWVLQRFTNL
jgi:DNA-directed RNA polymerase beta subunit